MESKEESTPSCCSGGAPEPPRWHRYIPLIVLIALAILAAAAKQVHYGAWDGKMAMHDFMGLFLLSFSMLKLFDLSGFADGFQKYDLLAGRSRPYALLYPFLELVLALGYLSHWQPQLVYLATIILMTFGAVGIFRALAKGLDLKCACMGSSLNVPLSTVAVIEDVGMAVMALAMLLF
ncbi:MAG: MauE/DoxX family redox-associated membrane protein [Roseibacillus sp.]